MTILNLTSTLLRNTQRISRAKSVYYNPDAKETRNDSKTLEHLQKVRLRQARRHREALRAVQGKPAAILERPQESRRRSRWRVAGGNCRREDEEEIENLQPKYLTTNLFFFRPK